MSRIKIKYGKGYKTRVFNTIPESQLERMRACVKIGYTPSRLLKEFSVPLPDSWADVIYDEHRPIDRTPIAKIGHKDEPYYEEEFPTMPVYRLEDLKGEEKFISKKDTSTRLWTWEE